MGIRQHLQIVGGACDLELGNSRHWSGYTERECTTIGTYYVVLSKRKAPQGDSPNKDILIGT